MFDMNDMNMDAEGRIAHVKSTQEILDAIESCKGKWIEITADDAFFLDAALSHMAYDGKIRVGFKHDGGFYARTPNT